MDYSNRALKFDRLMEGGEGRGARPALAHVQRGGKQNQTSPTHLRVRLMRHIGVIGLHGFRAPNMNFAFFCQIFFALLSITTYCHCAFPNLNFKRTKSRLCPRFFCSSIQGTADRERNGRQDQFWDHILCQGGEGGIRITS